MLGGPSITSMFHLAVFRLHYLQDICGVLDGRFGLRIVDSESCNKSGLLTSVPFPSEVSLLLLVGICFGFLGSGERIHDQSPVVSSSCDKSWPVFFYSLVTNQAFGVERPHVRDVFSLSSWNF